MPWMNRTAALKSSGIILLVLAWASLARGGELKLKDGTILTGKPSQLQSLGKIKKPVKEDEIRTFYVYMIDDNGAVRYFVPRLQVAEYNRDSDLGKFEKFTLLQKKSGRNLQIAQIGMVSEHGPFDEFGRRLVTLKAADKEINVIQGVVEINPRYVKVQGITHFWEFGMPISSFNVNVLDAMLKKATDPGNADHRLSIARFYLQAGLYFKADDELAQIRNQFPDLQKTVDKVRQDLMQLQAQQFVDELKGRKAAGQYQLVYEGTRRFPVADISGAILREVRDLATSHEKQLQQIEQVRHVLGELQAELPPEKAETVSPIRAEISERLHPANIERLSTFINLIEAGNVPPEEKLALAISGWVLGSVNATKELPTALSLWKMRFRAQEYLRTESLKGRTDIIKGMAEIEGVSGKHLAMMLPLLPPRTEGMDFKGGVATTVTIPGANDDEPTIHYTALPPIEYHPDRSYPMILALNAEGWKPEGEADWWGGTADRPGMSQRNGYIVIAPEYATETQTDYDYSAHVHELVLNVINDARRHFNIDSDRIYIAGHGMGADAALDIGFAHPHLFAGLISISGTFDKYCKFTAFNAKKLPMYIINGELEREHVIANNTRELQKMMQGNFPVIYAEITGRGHEHFFSEIGRLFEWMPRHKRTPWPDAIDAKALRPTDNQYWWWEFRSIPKGNALPVWPDEKTRINPLTLDGKVHRDSNVMILRCGASEHTIYLHPQLVDFDKRLAIRINGGQKFNDFLKPEMGTMLEDFRVRGDRQKIPWARVDF
jgi:predicted esterase